jgi:hypothetical protein
MSIGHKTSGDQSPATGDININNINDAVKQIASQIADLKKGIEALKFQIVEFQESNKKLKEKINKLLKNKRKNFFHDNWFLWGIIIIILGAILFSLVPVIQENYVGGILAFVGILATFIVVSNYMQVKEIEKKFDDAQTKLEQQFSKTIEQLKSDAVNTECNISCSIQYHRALFAKTNTEQFDAYIYAIASWSKATAINVNLIDFILSKMGKILNMNEKKEDEFISQFTSLNAYALDDCLQTISSADTKNEHKTKTIDFLQKLKEKGALSYDEGYKF